MQQQADHSLRFYGPGINFVGIHQHGERLEMRLLSAPL
jgi:hypothetical protein